MSSKDKWGPESLNKTIQSLTTEEREFLSTLFLHKGYETLVKLMKCGIIDLQSSVMDSGTKLEEFMGVKYAKKWAMVVTSIVEQIHRSRTKKRGAVDDDIDL